MQILIKDSQGKLGVIKESHSVNDRIVLEVEDEFLSPVDKMKLTVAGAMPEPTPKDIANILETFYQQNPLTNISAIANHLDESIKLLLKNVIFGSIYPNEIDQLNGNWQAFSDAPPNMFPDKANKLFTPSLTMKPGLVNPLSLGKIKGSLEDDSE